MPGLVYVKPLASAHKGRRAPDFGAGAPTPTSDGCKAREMSAPENAGNINHVRRGFFAAATKATTAGGRAPTHQTARAVTVFRPPVSLVRFYKQEVVAAGGSDVFLADQARAAVVVEAAGRERTEAKKYYSSSGSEHEPNSVCLAAMVHEFMEEEAADEQQLDKCGRARCNCRIGSCNELNSSDHDDDDDESSSVPKLGREMAENLQALTPCKSAMETSLLADVCRALETLRTTMNLGEDSWPKCSTGMTPPPAEHLRRGVMRHLRAAGHDAAICKSRWNHTGGFPGGDYEYIDIAMESADAVGKSISGRRRKKRRILVDIDFRAQFEIACPTQHYTLLVQLLPTVFVGEAEQLQSILTLMSEAIKCSLKKRGLDLPPWRKAEYIRAKWFSWHRRTTNPVSQQLHNNKTDPCPAAAETAAVQDFACIATRGKKGQDLKFTNEMEMLLFQPKTDHDSRSEMMMKMRGIMRNEITSSQRPTTSKHCYVKKQDQEAELEPPHERANIGGTNTVHNLLAVHHQAKTNHNHNISVERIDNMAWQPPEVMPRASDRQHPPLAGLTAILKETIQAH
ncbi:unnamed protein product [Sphagnum jensenii]|uniref:Uncharacterized protein n=1 Tax=Sphagnum jensenii TaxID=128206 RepID=A0ABP0VZM1_9BRYO